MPEITLYFAPGASSIFPHFLLYHCKIPFTPKGVLFRGPKVTDLTSINDKQQVPVITIDGETFTENPATAHAIHQLAPEQHLFGKTATEFVRVCEWMNWISAALHAQAWSPWLRPWRFTTDENGVEAVKEAAARSVRERFARLERKLDEKGPWALGTNFTAVDAYLLVFWRLGKDVFKEDMEGLYPRWTEIVERLMLTEAAKRAVEDEERARSEMS